MLDDQVTCPWTKRKNPTPRMQLTEGGWGIEEVPLLEKTVSTSYQGTENSCAYRTHKNNVAPEPLEFSAGSGSDMSGSKGSFELTLLRSAGD
jgi:hypothetical protein